MTADGTSPSLGPGEAPAGGKESQKVLTTLEDLTPEEKRCDSYITAIHELNRRKRRWGESSLKRVARDLGLDADQLKLTWCLLAAIEQTRQRTLAVRPSAEKSYLHILHGSACKRPQDAVSDVSVSENDIKDATEALLAAGNRGLEQRARIEAMLRRREVELEIREDGEYEDDVSLSSDDEDATPLQRMSLRAMQQLPNVDSIPEEQVSSIAMQLATFAESLKQGDVMEDVSENILRTTKHRTEALRWLSFADNSRKTVDRRRALDGAVESISEEAGVRLHPVAKRALVDGFVDEEALAEGGLHALRAVVPERFEATVRVREVRRVMGMMKSADVEVAERLVERFGSARRCLRAGVRDLGEMFGDGRGVVERMHGFDEEMHCALGGRVVSVWLVARVLKDKFGGLARSRQASFGEFMDGAGEGVELFMDERLDAYQAVHEASDGVDRERFDASWRLFRAVCVQTKAEDCVSVTRALLEEWDEGSMKTGYSILRRVAGGDVLSLCVGLGIDNDEAERLKLECGRLSIP